MVAYSALKAEMARYGITNTQIAAAMGVGEKTFRNKIRGITPFTWPEVQTIRDAFFPHMPPDELFARSDSVDQRAS